MVLKKKQYRSHQQRPVKKDDVWMQLRGSMKDIFAKLGGGEAYLRRERRYFYSRKTNGRSCE